MSQGDWQLAQGEALTRFLFSAAHMQRFAEFYTGETLDPVIDYHFRNGAGPKEESFCRRLFRQTLAQRVVDPALAPACEEMTLPGDNNSVSFSDFSHLPFHGQRWLQADLFSPIEGEFRFQLGTCGGVRIWNAGNQIACFTPFTRNKMQYCEIKLALHAGKNSLLIHLDELFERDTLFELSMLYLDDVTLGVGLPGIEGRAADILSQFTLGLRPELAVFDHSLGIHCTLPTPDGTSLRGEIRGMGNDNFLAQSVDFGQLGSGELKLNLPLPDKLGEAHYQLRLTLQRGAALLTRSIGINIMPNTPAVTEALTLAERKQESLRYTAAYGMDRTCRLLAMMHLHEYAPQSESLLNSTLQRISAREDCSDFSLVPLLWIWRYHQGEHFPAPLWRRVKSTILGYRYWLDELGSDVMWFWSENHALCFHTAQYLSGQFFPDERFIASGRYGRQQQAIAEDRLLQWFDAIEQHGFVEWNSAPYYPVDYIGLFALWQMAESATLRTRAGQCIDRLMLLSALHYQQGVAAGTMGRVYEKELLAGSLTELSAYGAVAWGKGIYNRKCASLPMFCASDYVPPAITQQYADMKKGELCAWYRCGGGNIVVWKAPEVTLSSCVDHLTGQPGHQQHLIDLQFASNPEARIWINHPGEEEPGGEKRPSFWAGNGIMPRVEQRANRLLAEWNINDDGALPWTHLHLAIDAFDQVIATDCARLVRAGEAFALILCSVPLRSVEAGLTAGRECRAIGRQPRWYIEVGYGDREAFATFSARAITLVLDEHFSLMDGSPSFPSIDGSGPHIVITGVED